MTERTITWDIWVCNAAGFKRETKSSLVEAKEREKELKFNNMRNRDIIDGPVPRVKDEYLQRSN